MNKKQVELSLTVVRLAIAILVLVPQLGFAQVCVDPPAIDGAPAVGAAPAGWSVASFTPDIVAGNGPWPGGGYTISDISGTSTSAGSMGLFLNSGDTFESWQTTLTGLTSGVDYQVAVEWQQATLLPGWPDGGQLRMTVDGVHHDFTSSGSVAGDSWQVAQVVFTAGGTTANLVLGKTPEVGDGAVVADSGEACSVVEPPGPATPVPTLSQTGLVAMALLIAFWGVLAVRNRRRIT